MIAYKFLRPGRVGPFSGFPWPEPGVRVRPEGALRSCRRGVHACRIQDLPWWLGEELWEIELDGSCEYEPHKVVASAGTLRTRVLNWTPGCAQDFADACAWRARDAAVEALRAAGHSTAAEEVAEYFSLEAVVAGARRLARELPDTRINLTIAGDGAVRALTGAPPTAAYIAAHAAGRIHGAEGYAAERVWQARWLAERLNLTASA